VKTRVGYNKVELDRWIPEILYEEPAALTVHARTRKEMSLVPARWEHVRETVVLRDKAGVHTLILGNGDVRTVEEARIKAQETGADGAMLGRAIFGNPWLFSGVEIPAPGDRLRMLSRHISLFDELLGDIKSYAVMKKHYKAYVSGWDGAKEIRDQLMETTSAEEAITTIKRYLDAFEN
jgi:tRNA-dihydrouridine synthase